MSKKFKQWKQLETWPKYYIHTNEIRIGSSVWVLKDVHKDRQIDIITKKK